MDFDSQDSHTEHKKQPELLAWRHLQLQNARHGEKQDHEVRDHVRDPRNHKHSIAVPTGAAGYGGVPIESQRPAEEEGLKDD